jgi:hypothetical protein
MTRERIKMIRSFFIFLIIAIPSLSSFAQQVTLADFFPLAIGNQWQYNYYVSIFTAPNDIYNIDTGFAEYIIINKIE